jgi:hypothetical protein
MIVCVAGLAWYVTAVLIYDKRLILQLLNLALLVFICSGCAGMTPNGCISCWEWL